MNHLDEDAELYALGLTGSDRSAEIEAHLAACEECRARVAAAESVAASLAGALRPMPAAGAAPAAVAAEVRAVAARPRWIAPVAVAAALVFAATAAFEASAAHAASAQLATTNVALNALASSHFGHTTLTGTNDPIAKAIYARDGSWYYVVAEHMPRGAHVIVYRGTTPHDLGALAAGEPATLFVRDVGRADHIAISARDGIVASGNPVY